MSKREAVGSPSRAKKSKMADVETKVSAIVSCGVAAALALFPPPRAHLGVYSLY